MKSTRYYLILSLLAIIMMRSEQVYANSSSEFKDQIIKDDNFYIIAETEKETLLEYKQHAFQAHYDPYTLADYCKKIGGTVTVSDSDIETSFFDLVEMKNITCSHPSGKGFVAKSTKAKRNPYWIYVKHDEIQPLGYALKQKIKDDNSDQYKTVMDMVLEGTNYFLDYGVAAEYCALKGGTYLISNEDTYGYAVDMTTYYMNVAKSVGNFITPNLPGNRWCIDTADPKDEFSMVAEEIEGSIPGSIHAYRTMHIIPTMGVDRSQIIYSTEPVPPYMMDKDQYIAMEENKTLPIHPSKELMDLAEKTMDSQTSSSITYTGKLYEGVYLGQKTDGCEHAAVWTRPVQFSDRMLIFKGKYQADQILNFKRCSANELEYIGESVEKHIPLDIQAEIDWNEGMCIRHKKTQSTYLGYDISCQYQSTGPELYFEIVVMRKGKFVGKYYIPMGIKDDRTLKERLRDRLKSVFF